MTDLGIERPRFFDGERLTAADLLAAQSYERELRWLHNRTLHPWGITRGLTVSGARGDRSVTVGAGYALDCMGRDIVVPRDEVHQVPAVPSGSYVLTVSWLGDDALEPSRRHGVCGADGAVRLPEHGLVRWRERKAVEPDARYVQGRDVVIAEVMVSGCALAAGPDTRTRDDAAVDRPYVGAGATLAGETEWRLWPQDVNAHGVATTVSTASAAFALPPRYQVSVIGNREFQSWDGTPAVVDGPVSIASPTATSVDVQVQLIGYGDLNPPEVRLEPFLARLRGDLGWHVTWIGVEG